MKVKYQVFISSTYKDLIEERQAAVEAILKAGHIPAGMELFKSGKTQLETIKKWIDESDIYLLILGQRYGSIDQESGKSYTHIEYEYALSKKMPVFAILVDKIVADNKVTSGYPTEDIFENEYIDLYETFLSFIKTKVVSFANNIDSIKLRIHENINDFQDEYNLVGWSKGSQYNYEELLSEINELRKENSIIKEKEIKSTNISEEMVNQVISSMDKLFTVILTTSLSDRNGQRWNYTKKTTEITIKYSELFALISPFLMDHPNEKKAKDIFERELKSFSKANGESPDISNQNFQSFKLHFIEINLIKVAYSKTTNGSMGLFWSLTMLGEKIMFKLRKI